MTSRMSGTPRAGQARGAAPCPACPALRQASHYLCRGCWWQLPAAARRSLWRRDALAAQRLLELHRQINDNVPLAEIKVTP